MDKVRSKLETVPQDQKDKLYKTLDISVMEQASYLSKNAYAFASGKIDLNTSQFVYNSLRNWSDSTLTERIAVTQLVKELIERSLSA